MLEQALLDAVAEEFPEYWAWLQGKSGALDKVKRLAAQYAAQATGAGRRVTPLFLEAVQALKSFQTWSTLPPEDGDGEEHVHVDEDGDGFCDVDGEPMGAPAPPSPEEKPEDRGDVRAELMQFLIDNELPLSLMTFIENALAQGMPFAQIKIELRNTPEYKAAYPENALRLAAGFDWMPEAEIRWYRAEARRLANAYFGFSMTNAEIAELVVRDKSLKEWENELQDYADLLQYGPQVRQALEEELGFVIDDEQLWNFFRRDIPTPELNRAYQAALMRGQPAVLGFGIRPEEEAEILREFGYTAAEAFKGYQGIAQELPRTERMKQIEAMVQGMPAPTAEEMLSGATWSQLFRALMLRDVDAFTELQQLSAREFARWRAGGGPAGGGAGLLAPEQR